MKTEQIFQLMPERCLNRCKLTDVNSRHPQEATAPPCWINKDHRDTVSLQSLLESIGVHPLAIEACLDPTPASLLAVYGKSLFIALPIHTAWDTEERTFLWIICLPRIIITIHEADIPALQQIIERYSDGMRFHGENTSAILYQILDHVIDEDMMFTLKTRDVIDRLDQLLDDNFDKKLTEETLPLKRQLTRLAATFEDQLYCVSSLQTIDSESFSVSELHEYFRDAFLHLEHASRVIGRQLAHLSAIEHQYQLNLQDKTTDRLRLLTVTSTIFLPLTLITGIYGMNFQKMPELGWPYAYPAVVSLMLLLAVGMLWNFYRRGWFQ
ncbi:magnesium transporter CorA family protein [Gimesia algae]|uniref:Magnesium transport protein CorA n=1 Tax=Gimesia algae TaxID=2527971 RepID=A0A517V6Y8_9PLAN|nr:magnesium transporter CorA family protein [Gimesia algae]QDT88769.1 Magnesium transport protein CorA [Gimesia algae]